MTARRGKNPNPPQIPWDGVERHKADVEKRGKDIVGLEYRFRDFEDELERGEITKTFVALEALTAIVGARIEGYSDEVIQTTFPPAWGQEIVRVPAALLREIAEGWIEYRESDGAKTLGEALHIEGRGQGKKPQKLRVAERSKARRLANDVVIEYLYAVHDDSGLISLEEAINKVAEASGVSPTTVSRAYKRYGPSILDKLSRL